MGGSKEENDVVSFAQDTQEEDKQKALALGRKKKGLNKVVKRS